MRRTLDFGTWKAGWWDNWRQGRSGVSAELAEGLYAYASEQAARERYWVAKWDAHVEVWTLGRDKILNAMETRTSRLEPLSRRIGLCTIQK
jgi:hypothetical protein